MAPIQATKVEVLVTYMQCRRNHIAPDKGVLYDGCGYFVPRSESGSHDAMLCAACNCHRCFHRRVMVEVQPPYQSPNPDPYQNQGNGAMITHREPVSAPPHAAEARRQTPTPSPAPTSPSASSGAADGAPREAPTQQGGSDVPRKRITRQQSEMLRAFSERNGWKMFREYSPQEVAQICSDIGVSRSALKSWISVHRRKRSAPMLYLNAPPQ